MHEFSSRVGLPTRGISIEALMEREQLGRKVIDGVIAIVKLPRLGEGVDTMVVGRSQTAATGGGTHDTNGTEGVQFVGILQNCGFNIGRRLVEAEAVFLNDALDLLNFLAAVTGFLQDTVRLLGARRACLQATRIILRQIHQVVQHGGGN